MEISQQPSPYDEERSKIVTSEPSDQNPPTDDVQVSSVQPVNNTILQDTDESFVFIGVDTGESTVDTGNEDEAHIKILPEPDHSTGQEMTDPEPISSWYPETKHEARRC